MKEHEEIKAKPFVFLRALRGESSKFYRTTEANIGDSINCWKLLSSALKRTTSLLVSLSTEVPSIAVFSVGVASIFLKSIPAFSTEDSVDAVTLSEVRTFRLK